MTGLELEAKLAQFSNLKAAMNLNWNQNHITIFITCTVRLDLYLAYNHTRMSIFFVQPLILHWQVVVLFRHSLRKVEPSSCNTP